MRIEISSEKHLHYAEEIQQEMANSARIRRTGIAQRSIQFLQEKMMEGSAVLALDDDGRWAGFCYLSEWSDGEFVANSGMIVSPNFRNAGVAKRMKELIFALSREKFPKAKVFSLTTGLAIMKINSELGYKPVTYSEITKDEQFWSNCQSCVNHEILKSKNQENCLCTAMVFAPKIEASFFDEVKEKNTVNEKECSISI